MHNKRETGRVSRETRDSENTCAIRNMRLAREEDTTREKPPNAHWVKRTFLASKKKKSKSHLARNRVRFIRNKKRHVSNKTLQAKFKTRPVSNHGCRACTKTRYARDETGLQKAWLRFARNKTTVLKRRRIWHNSIHASRETSRVVLPRPKLDCQPLFWK